MADTQDLPEDIEEAVGALDSALKELDEHLQPLLAESIPALQATLTPEEKAKCELTLAYAVNTLFWMYLSASGVDPQQHPIKGEMDRIKEYMAKLKDAVDAANAKGPSTGLDKVAANRFLRAALADAEDETKKQLKELGKKYEKDIADKEAMPPELAELLKQAHEEAAAVKRKGDTAPPASEKKKKKQK
eukprot:comp11560_c0_seq1/m.6029 comp11560_c0_seq1/g.6029  ORF comp11560_c0_seq1/g.6029 comp11560_c0_seq1/m.6029 type:complete len:189 (-) comp11560_c0_seq1:356-922(-)